MTLNNLLSVPSNWSPIVPDRRHSAPTSNSTAIVHADAESLSSSALQTLLSNLRNRGSSDDMVESHPSQSESDLLKELRMRVESLTDVLDPEDAQLALTIISLLAHFNRLAIIEFTASPLDRGVDICASQSQVEFTGSHDLFDTLKRQLSNLQIQRSSQPETSGGSPVLVVEKALLWSRIDEELEQVVSMCKERTEFLPLFTDHLPPQYDQADYLTDEKPPEYQPAIHSSVDDNDSKGRSMPSSSATALLNEKTRLDLEAVTMAIDRLYMVAPQLHSQRAELRSAKRVQLEKVGRLRGQTLSGALQRPRTASKQKEPEDKEFDSLVDLLAKAHGRKLLEQSVVLEGGLDARLENLRLRDTKKVRIHHVYQDLVY